MASELTTCVVADDHPAILLTICAYLERGGVQVVGRARSGDEAVTLIEAQQPTIAVIDAHMPGLSGTSAIRRVTRSTPQCATILYTAHDDPALLIEPSTPVHAATCSRTRRSTRCLVSSRPSRQAARTSTRRSRTS